MIKRFAAKLLTALAIHPAFRSASVNVPLEAKWGGRIVQEERDTFLLEIDQKCAVRPDYAARYDGHRTTLAAQLAVTVRNRRYQNACFSGRAEYEKFVAERTK